MYPIQNYRGRPHLGPVSRDERPRGCAVRNRPNSGPERHGTYSAGTDSIIRCVGPAAVMRPRSSSSAVSKREAIEPILWLTNKTVLPALATSDITTGSAFEERRLGCRVGTNRRMRYRTGVFVMRTRRKFSLTDWIDYVFCPGELISYRSQLGKACAMYESCGFDIFGQGWELLPETRGVYLGIPTESTLSYVGKYRYHFAFENHSSDCSLISERVWDALRG
jgi:hypothetical protein